MTPQPADPFLTTLENREIRSICAYCPDLAAREVQLSRAHPGAVLSHGCCWPCQRRLKEELALKNLRPVGRKNEAAFAPARPPHSPQPETG